MKKKIIMSILVACLIVSTFAGCKAKSKTLSATNTSAPSSTLKSSTSILPLKTPSITNAITTTATAAPAIIKIIEAQKGKPFAGATVLFSDNFDNNDFNQELAMLHNPDTIEFKDGKMAMGINKAWGGYCTVDTYAIDEETKQYEFSVKFKTQAENTVQTPWIALFIGCRVTDNGIADQDGGFWVAFTDQQTVAIYPGVKNWPAGAIKLPIPVSPMTEQTVTVIDNGDKIYYYITDASGANWLILRAEITETKVNIYGNDNKLAYTCDNKLNTEGAFKLFDHMGVTFVDSLLVKGA